jgi:hypothetical protein
MTGVVIRHLILAAAASVALAGCQQGAGPLGKPAKPDAAATDVAAKPPVAGARSVKLVDRDVEAPEIFQVTDDALWDGRPSLGGVWVASPDAKDPERVILRNAANGKFVIGALFRRERDNPGPKLQISSDAAAALGLLAGQPGKVSVTALRREEAPQTTPDATKPILDAAETVATETLDPVANAGAAIDRAAGSKPASSAVGAAPAIDTDPIAAGPITTRPIATGPTGKPASPLASGGGFIQIGIFSVETNAQRAADTLGKAGITANIRKEESQGKPFWSVTARGDAGVLGKIKQAGFKDAYFLKG